MAYNGFITTEIDTSSTMRQLALSLEWIEEPNCMRECGLIMRDYFNQYVPMQRGGGALRKSGDVSQSDWKKSVVTWKSPYAHYQFVGDVYTQNIPTFKGGQFSGWISVRGRKKSPALDGRKSRKMGAHTGTFVMEHGPHAGKTFHIDGYSTPGTGPDWIRIGRYEHAGEYREIRKKIIRALKRHYEKKRVAYYG